MKLFLLFPLSVVLATSGLTAQSIIIDHKCVDLAKVPATWITQAKQKLHIAYGHTSHGSQVISGMSGLVGFTGGCGGPQFAWNNGGSGGALDLHDYAMKGDCGYYPQWVNETKSYLDNPANSNVNVIMWSWCGQHASRTQQTMISTYLAPMALLQKTYPKVTFVYMTGHLNAPGTWQNTKDRNQQIRDWCKTNGCVLFDFADLESYDPDGVYYRYGDDSCNYYDAKMVLQGNWATNWQKSHILGKDWFSCSSAHSQPLNANQKAYAIWWLWARLAGWAGPTPNSGCPGTGNVIPSLAMSGLPKIGNSAFALSITGGLPHSPYFLLVSGNEATIPLAGGCLLKIGLPIIAFSSFLDGSGSSNFPMPIPNAPNLIGGHVYMQSFNQDPQGKVGPGLFASTPSLHLQIQ